MAESYSIGDVLREAARVGMKRYIRDLERRIIEQALKLTNNNCKHAAEILQMNRTTIVQKRVRMKMPMLKRGDNGTKRVDVDLDAADL